MGAVVDRAQGGGLESMSRSMRSRPPPFPQSSTASLEAQDISTTPPPAPAPNNPSAPPPPMLPCLDVCRSAGWRVGSSDQILGFDCGGQQWVLEVVFPTGPHASVTSWWTRRHR